MNHNHPVVLDYAGVSGRSRLTCYGEKCDCATLVYQPWMKQKDWEEKVEEFRTTHPFSTFLTWEQYKSLLAEEIKNEL